jgi:K+-sensing histidine kinase KdpD
VESAGFLGHWLVIKVQDTGIGIEEKNKDKLFKLFGFLEENFEKNKHGIGLGLCIATMIVDQFEGKIELES